jgi:hypothetical protein
MRLRGRWSSRSALALAVAIAPFVSFSAEAPSSCVACHVELDDELLAPVQRWKSDVHAEIGLGCHSCHGGDPSPELAMDPEAAMSHGAGFRPAPERLAVARFCGACHADAAFMKDFDPQARVDQLAEYRTSVHGRRNAAGDPVPATCIDCHGSHGIRRVVASDSPVHPFNVPETCSRCHADEAKMAPYGTPTTQYADYLDSAHAAALLDREDLAAPACNDCHGNHGAAPPGVAAVANVCGQCHGREAMLFRASFKKELFEEMEVAECTVCHGNHRVNHATPEAFRTGSAPSASVGTIVREDPLLADLGELEPGRTETIRWVGILRRHVEPGDERLAHTVSVVSGDRELLSLDAAVTPGQPLSPPGPRAAEADGFSASLTIDPLLGDPVRAGDAVGFELRITRRDGSEPMPLQVHDLPGPAVLPHRGSFCQECHEPGDACDLATEEIYASISSTGRELREAERILLRAERAGMDVAEDQFALSSGGESALLETRALIHGFDPARMIERAGEASGIARSGIEAGRGALAELRFRRNGLAVFLVLVVVVVVGLVLKIRQLDRSRGGAGTRE